VNWLEIIELRTASGKRASFDLYLKNVVEDLEREPGSLNLSVFSHTTLDCDYMLQLHHQSQQVELHGSDFGLRLVDALKDFGLVNHTVWIENFCD
jgi:hypothetical protein